ncbi:PAS domain-containing protein [Hufsiella ginkgonis]|uniref:histidine kinase n=1 Tax=Hufsiella ginkgonis TaxID=2695274 RepID=A0A7K1XVI3_9SPHI|nr:PAS domain-containing protein [Hufsiella ginkgonis]MXV14817.1 PAS domain-containing protein [Hufsiella ginkgonis]
MHPATDFTAMKELFHHSAYYYMICVAPDGSYAYINNRYANNFKHVSADFIGQPFYITMHPDDIPAVTAAGQACYQNPGKLFPVVIRKHNGNNEYIITQWEFSLMCDSDGMPTGVFCLGHDITEYEKAKESVTVINKDLSTKNELLGTIAFEQSHEVRAPLANIMGLVDIINSMEPGADIAPLLAMLGESSRQLDGVITRIVNKIRVPEPENR